VTVPGLKTTTLLFVPLFASFTLLTYPRVFVYCGVVQALVLVTLFLRATEYRFEAPAVAAHAAAGSDPTFM
jgi:hypothetical protein